MDTPEMSNTLDGEAVEVAPTYEALTLLLAEANEKLATAERTRKYYFDKALDLEQKVTRLDEWLTENWDDLELLAEPLAEIFGLDGEVEHTLTLNISAEVTITAERGFKVSDIDPDYDFDVSISSADRKFEVQDYSVESTSID